jgi:nitrogen fixation/metabolism regulation signal transduction histidine kinase
MSDRNKVQARKARIYIAGGLLFLLALLVFAQAAFDLSPYHISSSQASETVLLYTLSTCIFVALLIFGFVLLRMVVKALIERKQQKPGSRFKTSLLFALAGLMLIPAISLFAFAYGLVNRSIDKWFSVGVDNLFDVTRQMDQQWRAENQAMAERILGHLSTEMPANLDSERRLFRLQALIVIDNEGLPKRTSAEAGVNAEAMARAVFHAIGKNEHTSFNYQSGWIEARRVHTPEESGILAAYFPDPVGIADLNAQADAAAKTYHDLIQKQRAVKENYVILNALMTVLVFFAAVWVGGYLSKRITVPIAALSEATREISAGNLSHRVNIEAKDELGLLVTLFNDMGARLEAATEELETRRRYMEVILESIPTGVISLDTDLKVHTLNRAARTMFSVEKASALEEIFKGEDLKQISDLLDEAKENPIARQIAFATPGPPAQSAVTASRLTTGGFVLVVEDLTEVVRAQKASAWREVARRLAHEIKNPLTPIQLSAERIARNVSKLPGPSPRISAVVHECVDAIVDEVSSLKNLVDEFVRFARLPAVSRMPNSMHELIDKTLALYEGRMEGISIQVEIPEDLPLILMDPMQMKRVLVNLIDNALEALSSEPYKALRIACETARDGTMARLTLEDTGRGIAPEDRDRLFTPYFSTRKNGAGLGLAIASRIVADHGGYIGVEPNMTRGTRFVIELPVCQESSLSTTSRAFGSR